ncbi:MAG: sulfite exporter TauE/SafE family protein [Bacteroidales bacterium]|nr:sulfite exporter TauE/SafE family protein [Bacteroidales bacterium]
MKKLIKYFLSHPFHNRVKYIIFFCLAALIIYFLIAASFKYNDISSLAELFDYNLLLFIGAGFIAQLIDGALGMAYGVSCTSLLLGLNIAPAVASASVHVSEVFTAGASGISHLSFKNIHKKLFLRLVFFGVAGGILGAWFLSGIVNGNYIKPFISAYLLVLGVIIFRRAFLKFKQKGEIKKVGLLAVVGGFMDSVGGGGWGPIVTTNLIHKGSNPRRTIGTVNIAEFFVALASSGVFVAMVGTTSIKTILGLIIGGVAAAPLAAYVVKKVNYRYMLATVGLLISALSIYNLVNSWKHLVELAQRVCL